MKNALTYHEWMRQEVGKVLGRRKIGESREFFVGVAHGIEGNGSYSILVFRFVMPKTTQVRESLKTDDIKSFISTLFDGRES
jgi:hypothetical protein